MMIVDLPEPRNVEVVERSRNPIKLGVFAEVAKDFLSSMRGEGNGRDRDGRDSDSLDDTRSRLNPSVPPNDAEFRANDRRVQIPQWLLLVILLQGGGAIYSWATMRSDLNYSRQEIIRLEAKIDAETKARIDDVKVIGYAREKDKDLVRDLVRDAIADQLLTRGVFRVQPSNP